LLSNNAFPWCLTNVSLFATAKETAKFNAAQEQSFCRPWTEEQVQRNARRGRLLLKAIFMRFCSRMPIVHGNSWFYFISNLIDSVRMSTNNNWPFDRLARFGRLSHSWAPRSTFLLGEGRVKDQWLRLKLALILIRIASAPSIANDRKFVMLLSLFLREGVRRLSSVSSFWTPPQKWAHSGSCTSCDRFLAKYWERVSLWSYVPGSYKRVSRWWLAEFPWALRWWGLREEFAWCCWRRSYWRQREVGFALG